MSAPWLKGASEGFGIEERHHELTLSRCTCPNDVYNSVPANLRGNSPVSSVPIVCVSNILSNTNLLEMKFQYSVCYINHIFPFIRGQ